MKTLDRKELPNFAYLKHLQFDIQKIVRHCDHTGLLKYSEYNDIQVSAQSHMKNFVLSNSFNKDSFFTEAGADYLEGESYKQKYLTQIKSEVLDKYKDLSTQPLKSVRKDSIFFRQKRLKQNSQDYDPFADELNYGERNSLVTGVFEEILNAFKSPVTRVRLAYLAPNFSIKPHVDYDPSYITRYHIPIITNPSCTMNVIRGGQRHSCHYPADGRIYFLNTGFKHWAANDSGEARLHLIVDTHGQNDLNQNFIEIPTQGQNL